MTTFAPLMDHNRFRQIARELNPEARIVRVRGLRRVIRRLRDLDEFGSRAPHDLCLRLPLSQLRQYLSPSELSISADDEVPTVLLIPAADLDATEEDELRRLWRVLFHAAIDQRFDELVETNVIGRDQIEHFLLSWGPAQWAEIRTVLAEDYRIGNDDNTTIFREFIAHFLELRQFQPHDVHAYYPGLRQPDEQLGWLLKHFDVAAIAEQYRPKELTAVAGPDPFPITAEPLTGSTASASVLAKADAASAKGNDVRAAVLLLQAKDERYSVYVRRLCERLHNSLPVESFAWLQALRPMFAYASDGVWSVERRILYQLQKACLNLERVLFAIDVGEWIQTLGKQKIKRKLTKPRWLFALRHLRSAAKQLDRSRLTATERDTLYHGLEQIITQADQRARADLRPEIVATFDNVGLVPTNTAEAVSRDKAVEELLDTAVDKGIIRIGDLRDTIARNRIKLPDLQGPTEFFTGDPLLRANRELAVRLDGVYKRGEFYMRWLQRGCSLFFGTKLGRVFTKYVALPLGGAYVVVEAFNHAVEAVEGAVHWLSGVNVVE